MNFEFDVDEINSVLQNFYTVTKIKTVLCASDLSVITAVPFEECAFCTAFAQNKASKVLCDQCTKNALLKCQKEQKLQVYTCHAGLIEAVAPILMDEIIVGYMMLGQVLKSGSSKARIAQYAAPYIGDKAGLYLNELVAKTDEEIHAAIAMMQSCVCYFLMNKLIKEEQGNLSLQLKEYIENNPAADLSADALRKKFAISRNSLYKISNTYFGMPIAQYVRIKRLTYAQTLIQSGCSVTSAAEQAGFADYSYFGKLFKQYLGKTPLKAKAR